MTIVGLDDEVEHSKAGGDAFLFVVAITTTQEDH